MVGIFFFWVLGIAISDRLFSLVTLFFGIGIETVRGAGGVSPPPRGCQVSQVRGVSQSGLLTDPPYLKKIKSEPWMLKQYLVRFVFPKIAIAF